MPFEFGDVVLVPFPFTSQAASKKHPAVVVSSRTCNTSRAEIVVMAVTLLQIADDAEQVVRLRIALRAEHADQAVASM